MTRWDALQPVLLGVDDYPEILDLWQRAGLHIRPQGRDAPDAFARQLATGVQTAIGLRADEVVAGTSEGDAERLVGVVIATHDSRKGWINRLAVDPACRGCGQARRLIRACEAHFQGLGIDVWAALIEGWNADSLAMFRAAGYAIHDDIVYVSRRSDDRA